MKTASTQIEHHDPQCESVVAEYFDRLDRGEVIDREEFLAAYPDLADELAEFLDAADLVERLAGPTEDELRDSAAHDTAPTPMQFETRGNGPWANSARRDAPEENLALPRQFGRYLVLKQLGQGAMGSVYLANDTELDRYVALKIPRFLASDGADVVERFYREARASATIRHPNVCPVFDVGKIDGCLFISMAYIEGEPLSSLPPVPPEKREGYAARIVAKLARALHEAHLRGVVHRDLKPANIMLDRQGEPIVTDFGLARRIGGEEGRLTQSGVMVGSPAYMSPEQIAGNPAQIGPLSDIYSLGIILYELLAGKLPYEGSLFSIIGQIALSEPRPISQKCEGLEVDRRLEAICLKMMARRPHDRYGDMAEVAAKLEAFLGSRGRAGGRLGVNGVVDKSYAAREKLAKPRRDGAIAARHLPTWLARRNVQICGVALASILILVLLAWLNPFAPRDKNTAGAAQQEASPGDSPEKKNSKTSTPAQASAASKTSEAERVPAKTANQPVEVSAVRVAGFLGTPFGVGRVQLEFAAKRGPIMQPDQTLLIADARGRVHYPIFTPEWEADDDEEVGDAKAPPAAKRRLRQVTAHFLFAGETPLNLSLALDDLVLLRGNKLEPEVAGSQGHELLQTWWGRYASQRPGSREAWEVKAYLNDMLARRVGMSPQSPPREEEGADVSQIERHFERAVQTLFGFESVQTAMQDRTLLGSRDEEQATEAVPPPLRIFPVSLPPFTPTPVEMLAMRVPADCFYLRCQTVANYLWFRNILLQWGGSTSEIVSPRMRDTQSRERIEAQLALRPDAAAEAALRGAISDLAIIGSDPCFEDGAAVGALFELRDKEKFHRWLAQMRAEAKRNNPRVSEQMVKLGSHQASLLSSPDQTVRSFLADDGDYVLVTNSSHLAARFFEVKAGPQSLGELHEFRYARGKVRVYDEQAAFLYLSDPFFRRLVSPQYRIELTRRMRAKAELRDLALAQLAARGEGLPDASVERLLIRKFLPQAFGTRCDGSRAILVDGRPIDSRRGLPGTFTPIPDISVERATRNEVAAFYEFGRNYAREWRAVDPVTVVLTRRPHENKSRETVAVDITVTPYAQQRYARLAARLAHSTKEHVVHQPGDLLGVDAVLRSNSGRTVRTYAGVRDAAVAFRLEDGQVKLADGSADGSFAVRHSFVALNPADSDGFDALKDLLDGMGVSFGSLSNIGPLVGEALSIPARLPRLILSMFFPAGPFRVDPPPASPPRVVRYGEGWDVYALQDSIRQEVQGKLSVAAAAESSQVRLKLSDVSGMAAEPYLLAYTFLQERRASARNAQLFDLAAQQFHLQAKETPAALQRVFGAKQVCPLHGAYRAEHVEGLGTYWQSTGWNERSLHLENAVPKGYEYPFLAWLHGMRLRFSLDQTTLTAQVELDVTKESDAANSRAAAKQIRAGGPPLATAIEKPTVVFRPVVESVADATVKTAVLVEEVKAEFKEEVMEDEPPVVTESPGTDESTSLNLFAPGVLGVRIESDESLVVRTVYRGSVAAEAGLKIGDELLSVNRRRIATYADLRRELLAASESGSPVVKVRRQGRTLDIPVRLAGRPAK